MYLCFATVIGRLCTVMGRFVSQLSLGVCVLLWGVLFRNCHWAFGNCYGAFLATAMLGVLCNCYWAFATVIGHFANCYIGRFIMYSGQLSYRAFLYTVMFGVCIQLRFASVNGVVVMPLDVIKWQGKTQLTNANYKLPPPSDCIPTFSHQSF
jgi:hypothetical protein